MDTPGNDNGFAVYNAVQCTDVQWPTSWAVWSRDNHRVNKIAPFETWANAWFNAPCLHWPAPASRQTPMQINGSGISSALLIDETLDAATPFEGSLEVRKLFPHSVLLAEPGGTTHADSLSGDLCVDNTIANYLASGGCRRGTRTRSGTRPASRCPGRSRRPAAAAAHRRGRRVHPRAPLVPHRSPRRASRLHLPGRPAARSAQPTPVQVA